jgi:uncharacterized protein involved in exopolysaccharide biosynthesis
VGGASVVAIPPTSDTDIDFVKLFATVLRQKRLVLWSSVLTSLGFLVGSFFVTPVYTSTVLLKPVAGDDSRGLEAKLAGQLGGLVSMAGISLGGDTSVKQAIATMESRIFAKTFIAENRLLQTLFADDWDPAKKAFKEPTWWEVGLAQTGAWINSAELKLEDLRGPSAGEAFDEFSEILDVAEFEQEGLVSLSITWEDPVLAAQWANAIVALINKQIREGDAVVAQKSIAYLNKEIEKTNLVNLRETLYHLIEEQTQVGMLTNVREDYVFKVIDPAVVPEEKSGPRRTLFALLGFLLAGMVSAGWVLASEKRKTNCQVGVV